MSSLASITLFLALVTTSVLVAVMYAKLRKLDRYHAEYRQIFDQTGKALESAQAAVLSFGTEGRETLALLGARIEEARALAQHLEALTQNASRHMQSHSSLKS